MKRKSVRFKQLYFLYLAVLAVLVIVASCYVRGLLRRYEAAQPERQVEAVIEQLAEEAASPDAFWQQYGLPAVQGGRFESGRNLKADYLALFTDGTADYAVKNSVTAEDERCYEIRSGSFPLAEVTLKATGPATTKLAVFSTRDWQVQSVKPVLQKREYTVQVPSGFSVSVNGVSLADTDSTAADNGTRQYTVSDVYLEPQFTIADSSGATAAYAVKNFRVLPELYDYTLTLPATLTVTVNGQVDAGTVLSGGKVRHTVMQLQKPTVTVSDLYGNTVEYTGEKLPLTYLTVIAPPSYTVSVGGHPVPEAAVTSGIPEDYALLEGLVDGLPQRSEYSIAVLKTDAAVTVRDGNGQAVDLPEGTTRHDFTEPLPTADTVPADIAAEVDVLEVAQQWSLFMSNDLSFKALSAYMLPDSYQYTVAKAYSTSVDRTFFSNHTLLSPAFTDTQVSNYTRITDDSFSVNIHFVKHLRVGSGKKVDDTMNDCFYFVRRNNTWLLAGMKEVANNG